MKMAVRKKNNKRMKVYPKSHTHGAKQEKIRFRWLSPMLQELPARENAYYYARFCLRNTWLGTDFTHCPYFGVQTKMCSISI